MGKGYKSSFETSIYYKDYSLDVIVSYTYYIGTTPAAGDDPTEIEITKIEDANGKDITQKYHDRVSKNDWDIVVERAFEHCMADID